MRRRFGCWRRCLYRLRCCRGAGIGWCWRTWRWVSLGRGTGRCRERGEHHGRCSYHLRARNHDRWGLRCGERADPQHGCCPEQYGQHRHGWGLWGGAGADLELVPGSGRWGIRGVRAGRCGAGGSDQWCRADRAPGWGRALGHRGEETVDQRPADRVRAAGSRPGR